MKKILALLGSLTLVGLYLGIAAPAAQAASPGYAITSTSYLLINDVNVYRSTNTLIEYTPARGATTGTNQYGAEATVIGGVVTAMVNGVGNAPIPSNGYVLSGHGTARTWVVANLFVGAHVTIGPKPSGATELLPDLAIRTLRQFQIVNSGGIKELKFPVVTSNIGAGPMEINATRSCSTCTDWVAHQTVYMSDGTKEVLPAVGAQFYFAGDGHNHWHIKDFDLYQLFDSAGNQVNTGAKHGYCIESNTQYRNWPGNPNFPASPLSPNYTDTQECGVNQPSATTIQQGLSVGWGDTYPASLPDQYIDITGLPDGTYKVKITADWQSWWKETTMSDNSASATISISGNTVTLISATDGA